MNIINLAQNLELSEQGVWTSKTAISSVSYPDDGNARCFEVEDHSYWFKHRNDCIIAAMKRFPPSGNMLEIGGGNGYVTRRILDEGFECALLDPGRTGTLNAKLGRGIPDVICSTLEAAKFEPGKLTAVGMFDVIEHIEDDHSMLDQIYGLLQPGGLVYYTVPMHQWLWSKHDVTAGHIRRYNKVRIEQLISYRFELLYFSYFFSALILPMFILKALPFRLLGGHSILSQKIEHGTEGFFGVDALFRLLLSGEIDKIKSGNRIKCGTSGLVIMQKILS